MQPAFGSELFMLFFFVSIVVVGCAHQAPRPAAPFAAVGTGPLVIAHRGGSLEAPENTLASIRHGVAVGADWQEIDVTLSKDGEVVVIHDDTLERTTTGKGEVTAHSLAQLQKLTAGRPQWAGYVANELATRGLEIPDFGTRFAKERIPTLREVLLVPDSRVMIELKTHPDPAKLAEEVIAVIDETNARGRVALGSFEFATLEAVAARDPSLPLIAILDDPALIQQRLDMLPVAVLAVYAPLAAQALQIAPATVAVWAWTAYAPDDAVALAELGVHGVITDAPAAVLARLRREPPLLVE